MCKHSLNLSVFCICVLLLAIVKPNVCKAQTDSLSTEEYLYNRVYKNIAAYYIEYNFHRYPDHIKDGVFRTGYNTDSNGKLRKDYSKRYSFDDILPDLHARLEMDIEKLDWSYPINGFVLYSIELNGIRMRSSIATRKATGIVTSDGSYNDPPGRRYLIAINKKQQIIFISGIFFIDDITHEFNLDFKNPTSYLEYLKFRTNEYELRNIRFIKKKGKVLTFSAFSDRFKCETIISINYLTPTKYQLQLCDEQ